MFFEGAILEISFSKEWFWEWFLEIYFVGERVLKMHFMMEEF